MADVPPSIAAPVSGQLSEDGRWVWDGTSWEPSVSPDGAWRWDGREWVSTGAAPIGGAVSADPWSSTGPVPQEDELDEHRIFAAGELPTKVDDLPGPTTYRAEGFAIGQGWVARRPLAGWHVMTLSDVRTVALVPPTNFTEWAYSRSVVAPLPDLALSDSAGHTLRVCTSKFDPQGTAELRRQLTAQLQVTPNAAQFLDDGTLPGNWGQRFKNSFRMWPYH